MQIVRRAVIVTLVVGFLAGCSQGLLHRKQPAACDACDQVQSSDQAALRPQPRSAAALDQSTATEKKAALARKPATETTLGRTVASLGDVAEQGFWLKTPLVKTARSGRLVWADNGNSVNVNLIPKGGASTSGSQISLAAMRALGIPLTGLVDLIVYAQ